MLTALATSGNWVTETIRYVGNIGEAVVTVVQVITGNAVGAFLVGVYVVATLVHSVWRRLRGDM